MRNMAISRLCSCAINKQWMFGRNINFLALVRVNIQGILSTRTVANTNQDSTQNEYSEIPEYPTILDMSLPARKYRKKLKWHKYIKALTTIEEKLFELNMPKYYGWYTLIFNTDHYVIQSLVFQQFVTRTVIVEELPELAEHTEENIKITVDKVIPLIERAVELQYMATKSQRWRNLSYPIDPQLSPSVVVEKKDFTRSLCHMINRALLGSLSNEYDHLLNLQVDYMPRIEAFWFTGGIPPDIEKVKIRKGIPWNRHATDEEIHEPIDRPFQVICESAILQLRTDNPIAEFVAIDDPLCMGDKLDVPRYDYEPRELGMKYKLRHGTNVHGCWPSSPNKFGPLCFHSQHNLYSNNVIKSCRGIGSKYLENEIRKLTQGQAIMASYASCLAQASYHGFTTFNDLTYPITTQTILTDGQYFAFACYQLNTTLLHSHHIYENPRNNVCWVTERMELYDVDEKGHPKDINRDTVANLVRFYMNAPAKREGVDLNPYLCEGLSIESIEDDEMRDRYVKHFKHLYANRPRHYPKPEMFDWERIYKWKRQTRPYDRRLKFYELPEGLRKHPGHRRLDDRVPKYIPKALRQHKHRRERNDIPIPHPDRKPQIDDDDASL